LKKNPEIYKELNEYKDYLYQMSQDHYQTVTKETYVIPYDKLVEIKHSEQIIY
jgi:hypothetical protein